MFKSGLRGITSPNVVFLFLGGTGKEELPFLFGMLCKKKKVSCSRANRKALSEECHFQAQITERALPGCGMN